MNLDLIRWWTNWMPFEDYELKMRDKIDSDSIDYSEALKPQQFSNCEEQLLSYMPWVGNDCKDKHFHFTKSYANSRRKDSRSNINEAMVIACYDRMLS